LAYTANAVARALQMDTSPSMAGVIACNVNGSEFASSHCVKAGHSCARVDATRRWLVARPLGVVPAAGLPASASGTARAACATESQRCCSAEARASANPKGVTGASTAAARYKMRATSQGSSLGTTMYTTALGAMALPSERRVRWLLPCSKSSLCKDEHACSNATPYLHTSSHLCRHARLNGLGKLKQSNYQLRLLSHQQQDKSVVSRLYELGCCDTRRWQTDSSAPDVTQR
jgi:hypothetical protein